MRKWILFIALIYLPAMAHAQGACPSSAPVTGNHCYFIAANGSDSNGGTSEATPWLHAPGMPNCSGTCATVQSSWGSHGNTPMSLGGIGLIFRGGDTWHFGNSGASPYTGGTWNIWWSGNSTCAYDTGTANCFYVGVDAIWYSGSSWARPILNGDNPTSTARVSSCTYQTGPTNQFVWLSNNENTSLYFDSFEFTGLCSNDIAGACNNANCSTYTTDNGKCGSGCTGIIIKNNLYFHGWTTTTAIPTTNTAPCTLMAGGGVEAWDHLVVDGSDSSTVGALQTCQIAIFPYILHMRDSIFRYAHQIVATTCHDIHDNIFEHYANHYYTGGHDNALECNSDASGSTPNVYYNNIMRHFDLSFGNAGQVDLWFCPNTTPEYWFNNLMYDLNPAANAGSWDIAGPRGYPSCTNSGGQFMFNNTLVDTNQPCYLNPVNNGTGGKYLTVLNEHLINSPVTDGSGAGGCIGGPGNGKSATNVFMSDASAKKQGYTTGSRGFSGAKTCANDTTTPCGPTSGSNSTVGAGGNHQAYCTTLASYSSEYAIGTEAANACKYGTTDGCFYNSTTHTMNCPAQTAVARPLSGPWDAGAYQFVPPGAVLPAKPF